MAMFSNKIGFLAARFELQAGDMHNGNDNHHRCRRRRQRPENEENRKRVDGVANNAKWSAEN